MGSIEPRKNIKHFLEAYNHMPASLKKYFMVVHVGPSGWLNTEIHTTIEQLESKGRFKALGYLSENELVSLYAGGLCFGVSFYLRRIWLSAIGSDGIGDSCIGLKYFLDP